MKMAVFLVIVPCSRLEVYRRFRLIALMMKTASISETSVNFYQTTRSNNPEDSHLHLYVHTVVFRYFVVVCGKLNLDIIGIYTNGN
jgi:hypothetical protein